MLLLLSMAGWLCGAMSKVCARRHAFNAFEFVLILSVPRGHGSASAYQVLITNPGVTLHPIVEHVAVWVVQCASSYVVQAFRLLSAPAQLAMRSYVTCCAAVL
jgi:hypothetical protein